MYFLYVDGSGQTKIKRNSQNNGLYILGGVLVHEKDWKSIEEKLGDLKRELFPRLQPYDWELHAHDIWNSTGFFAREDLGLNDYKKEEIFSRVIEVACESEITIINVIIFKDRIMPKRSLAVVKYSWLLLIGRFERFLRQKQTGDNNGLLFIDSSPKTSESEIREAIWRLVRIDGSRRDILRVIEEPIFVESHKRNLIQLADMIAYVVHKYYKADPMFAGWFESLKPKMYHSNGKLYGFGIREFPSTR